jgi:hypothetical protein
VINGIISVNDRLEKWNFRAPTTSMIDLLILLTWCDTLPHKTDSYPALCMVNLIQALRANNLNTG